MIPVHRAEPNEWSNAMYNVYSQYGEDGVLARVFELIGTTNKQCFEVGAADGKWFSNSRNLIDKGWKAVLIEDDKSNYAELDKLDGVNGSVVVHGRAESSGPCSLDSILAQALCQPNMDLGIIDVDGQDYYLWLGMLKYRPRVIVIEFDPAAKPDFIPERNGPGQAGMDAIFSLAASKGYVNVITTYTNAIFVVHEEHHKLGKPAPKAEPALQTGKAGEWFAPTPLAASTPVLAKGDEQEIKICAVLSRPRFGLNVFFDCASEALNPWHIPIQSFYGVFWGQCMQKAMEDNIAQGVDWILTLDYDTLFTSKHVQLLIDALGQNPEIDAISALQPRRGRPLPLMVRPDGQAPMTGGPVQATTSHFGLTILRVEAIKKMEKPWFWSTPTSDGGWGEGRLDDDIYFWGKFRDAGNKLFVHTGCKIGHVEEMAAQYNDAYDVEHLYLSEWRAKNGHQIKNFE
jgi:hypothetical protein